HKHQYKHACPPSSPCLHPRQRPHRRRSSHRIRHTPPLLPARRQERIAVQAAKWGPRWEKNLSHIAPRMEKGAARIEPRMQKGVKVVEPPMKRAAFAIDRNIKSVLNASK
ncbi:hypothetical protein LARI1_G009597, partial [Lachnellula arida]